MRFAPRTASSVQMLTTHGRSAARIPLPVVFSMSQSISPEILTSLYLPYDRRRWQGQSRRRRRLASNRNPSVTYLRGRPSPSQIRTQTEIVDLSTGTALDLFEASSAHATARRNALLTPQVFTILGATQGRFDDLVVTSPGARVQYGSGSRRDDTQAAHQGLFLDFRVPDVEVVQFTEPDLQLSGFPIQSFWHPLEEPLISDRVTLLQGTTSVLPSSVNGIDTNLEGSLRPAYVATTQSLINEFRPLDLDSLDLSRVQTSLSASNLSSASLVLRILEQLASEEPDQGQLVRSWRSQISPHVPIPELSETEHQAVVLAGSIEGWDPTTVPEQISRPMLEHTVDTYLSEALSTGTLEELLREARRYLN